jgi:hypothetical protein
MRPWPEWPARLSRAGDPSAVQNPAGVASWRLPVWQALAPIASDFARPPAFGCVSCVGRMGWPVGGGLARFSSSQCGDMVGEFSPWHRVQVTKGRCYDSQYRLDLCV